MTVKQILANLESQEDKKIEKALEAIKSDGGQDVLEPLMHLWNNPSKSNFHPTVLELFSSLKDTSVCDEVVRLAQDLQFEAIRQPLLSSMWNSQLDYSQQLAEIVELAVDGSMLEALDCLTIMENMAGPFVESKILEAQLLLQEYVADDAPKDPQKMEFLSEIALKIKEFSDNEWEDIAEFMDDED